ncbi:MAG: PQQ-binding-like beta-propeller repeat protein, partial [Verrucomicrobiota bacterium]
MCIGRFFLALLVLTSPLSAGDDPPSEWPRFRGPNGSGVGQHLRLPTDWNEAATAWRISLPGTGHSSPVLAGNRLFLLCGDSSTSQRTALAIDASTGKTLWRHEFSAPKFKGHRYNSPASSTATVDQDCVYFTWGSKADLQVLALTHAGEKKWQVDLGPVKGGHGFGGSPIIHGDL